MTRPSEGEKDSGLAEGRVVTQARSSDAEEEWLELLRLRSSSRLIQHLRDKPTPFHYTDQTWIEKNGNLGETGFNHKLNGKYIFSELRSYFACWL